MMENAAPVSCRETSSSEIDFDFVIDLLYDGDATTNQHYQ